MKAIKKLFFSFKYAFSGLVYCIKNCRNFRIHTVAAFFVLYLSKFYSFSAAEYSILFLVVASVISAECFNTSIEQVCDAVTTDFSKQIKTAKDTAAAAVFCIAIFAVVIALKLFIDFDVFNQIYVYYSSPLKLIFLSVSVILSIIYIFYEDIFKNAKQ